jgi:hypothetical protein
MWLLQYTHVFCRKETYMSNSSNEVSIPQVAESIPLAANSNQKPDPFDVSRLRLSQDFMAAAGVKKLLTTVPVKKPSKEWFIRTHPSQEYHIDSCVIELKEDAEVYLVEPSLWNELCSESTFGPRALITAINRQGIVFLWPIRLPGPDGRLDNWSRSALEIANLATDKWVRVQSNMSLGAYEVYEAAGTWPDPEWNIPPLNELLRIAFKDRFVQSLDHPVIRRLRGEA